MASPSCIDSDQSRKCLLAMHISLSFVLLLSLNIHSCSVSRASDPSEVFVEDIVLVSLT